MRLNLLSSKKENRSVPVSFRLTESEFAPYKLIMDEASISRTEFFRAIFLSKQYTFTKNQKDEIGKILFAFNKTSNNINQIAKRLNTDNKKGIISQRSYNLAINELISIQSQLQRLIEKC